MRPHSLLATLALAACSAPQSADDRSNATDPAVADAMAGPIMTDMAMGGAAAPDALRPGNQPPSLPVPIDARLDMGDAAPLGEVVRLRMREAAFAGCAPAIAYSALWSLKLPKPFDLPKDARLSEAAGSDRAGCGLRIVRIALPGAPDKVLGDYDALAKGAGFAATKAGATLTGVRAKDGAALWINAVASKDGTRVDLITRAR